MSDCPRPAHSMSATHHGFAFSRSCAAAVSLALAATLLPVAVASARHAAAIHAAPAHAAAHAPSPGARAAAVSRPAGRSSAAHSASVAHHPEPQALRATRGGRGASPATRTQVRAAAQAHGRALPAPAPVRAMATAAAAPKGRLPASRPSELEVTDASTMDRVHAWYRSRAESSSTAVSTAPGSRSTPKPVAALPSETGRATKAPATPDLDLSPRKATTADFDRAAQKQADTLRAAAAVKSTRTTADDDDAFAEASHIPSTAPTERIPAPFVHGDLLAGGTRAGGQPRQATLEGKLDAPTDVRAVTHIDPRGDAEVLSSATGSTAVAINLKPGEVVPMPKPVAAPILRMPAPAAATVAAAASKPKLDPRAADALTQQTFDSDEAPTPVVVAASAPVKAGRTDAQGRPALVPAAGGYDVDLSGGPLVKVNLYDTAGKLILLPAMKGSHEILVHQNQMAIADGLDRVEDDGQLSEMRRLKLLVALPDTDGMYPDSRLPLNRRYARPWTIRFLNDLSRAHFARFHTPLIVTSAVRTVAFQRRLVLTNGNAAPPTGEVASPHLYGQAVDIAKHGMSVTEIAWMRSYLTPVETAGKIDVEEEFQQSCFHLSVYRRYLGLPAPRNTPMPEIAPSRVLQQVKAAPSRRRRLPTALLATGLR